ncbi:hypothetical protein GCM10009676_45420 [Prauserella halophila]|uniref:Type I-E CRISPR-associated protein Cas6/Cse3/CasE n=1 Tax=Prauserella halophila TaxID=185641 RepID=A0ABP4HBE2_9PSEU|nr:type I-E CRISPR-associated protein Cas6/Cse3/CasE [Prauserella halophila]MCP2237598.1 CRISPR associated protein [Prauserella halophila]
MGSSAVTSDFVITTSDGIGLEAEKDRDFGHWMSISLFAEGPDYVARRENSTLWAAVDARTIIVRTAAAEPTHLPKFVEHIERRDIPTRAVGDHVSVRVDLAAHKSPIHHTDPDVHARLKSGANGQARPAGEGLAYRVNKVPVPAAEVQTWATAKLARHGVEADDVDIEWYREIRYKRGRSTLPVARVYATGTVTDADTWNEAVTTAAGLGKGKSWGTGCILERN